MSLEQKVCFDAAMNGENLFISGAGGVGKSFVVGEIIKEFDSRARRFSVAASTGVAALNVGGVTIHSFLGTGLSGTVQDAKDKLGTPAANYAADRLRRLDTLIVDEVSMLSGDYLTMMDWWLRQMISNPEPFAGIQIILVGDFLQLPPVEKGEDKLEYRYAFNSPSWDLAQFKTIDLTKSYRQSDQIFINALNRVRFGEYPKEVRKVFRPCICRELDDPTFLVATNKEASTINFEKYRAHEGEEKVVKPTFAPEEEYARTFKKNESYWEDVKSKLVRNSLTDSPLRLKEGVPVLILKNNREKGYVNGQRGTVERIDCAKNGEIIGVSVRLLDGDTVTIEREVWEFKNANKRVMASMHHFPLRLGWALTIHKSQGLTLDNVEVDLSRGFAPGQAYVALSRMKSLEGLALSDAIDPSIVRADPDIVRFYDEARIAAKV